MNIKIHVRECDSEEKKIKSCPHTCAPSSLGGGVSQIALAPMQAKQVSGTSCGRGRLTLR